MAQIPVHEGDVVLVPPHLLAVVRSTGRRGSQKTLIVELKHGYHDKKDALMTIEEEDIVRKIDAEELLRQVAELNHSVGRVGCCGAIPDRGAAKMEAEAQALTQSHYTQDDDEALKGSDGGSLLDAPGPDLKGQHKSRESVQITCLDEYDDDSKVAELVDVRKPQPKFDGALIGLHAQRNCLIEEIKGRLGDVASICEMFDATGGDMADLQEAMTSLQTTITSRHSASTKSTLDRAGDDHFEANQELLKGVHETLQSNNTMWSEQLTKLGREAGKQHEYQKGLFKLHQEARDHAAEKRKWTAEKKELDHKLSGAVAQHKEEQLKWTAREEQLGGQVAATAAKHEKERDEWQARERDLERRIASAVAEREQEQREWAKREEDLNQLLADVRATTPVAENKIEHVPIQRAYGVPAVDARADFQRLTGDYQPMHPEDRNAAITAGTEYPSAFTQQQPRRPSAPLAPLDMRWQSQATQEYGFQQQVPEMKTQAHNPYPPQSIVPYAHQSHVPPPPTTLHADFDNLVTDRLQAEADDLYNFMCAQGHDQLYDNDNNVCWQYNSLHEDGCTNDYCNYKHRYIVHDRVCRRTGRVKMVGIRRRYMVDQRCADIIYNNYREDRKRNRRRSVAMTKTNGYRRRY